MNNVENMFFVREKPWHGLGTRVETAPSSADALRLAGLDWSVEGKPIYTIEGNEIPGFVANTRSSDGSVLGVATDKYRVVQNVDAFDFTDSLLGGGDIRYETAGSLKKGKQIWLLARMPEREILGDKVEPYLCFTNTHDGSGAIRVCATPVRVVCNNTLNLALRNASRTWSARHTGDMEMKLDEAKQTLGLMNTYMDELSIKAEDLAKKHLTMEAVEEILDDLFPTDDPSMTERKRNNMQDMKDEFIICYMAPDLLNFAGTAWQAVNAMADMVDHAAPKRNSANYQENRWGKIMGGHVLLDRFTEMVEAKCV